MLQKEMADGTLKSVDFMTQTIETPGLAQLVEDQQWVIEAWWQQLECQEDQTDVLQEELENCKQKCLQLEGEVQALWRELATRPVRSS